MLSQPAADGHAPDPAPSQSKASAPSLPQTELALAELALLAADEWLLRPQLTLLWTSSADFKQLASDFRGSIQDTDDAGDALAPQSNRLAVLDALINDKLRYVKNALANQYDEEDDGRPYYPEFGIGKFSGTWQLPKDRVERTKALKKLVAALPKHGLGQQKHGTDFWAPIAKEYAELTSSTAKGKGLRATEVAGKGTLREQVEDVLEALKNLLKANYPNTHQAEKRKFGFLKETY
ncbi:hypothetical protein [Hymenobacter jeollabukensis]|uniref:Uncharacterized protein n=1 Tax=Hymenobacter jeollabukensis TaxID=2025313 RepID=A0A5R8WLP0_9BACT|nr:hypothetical protein [Hymenobacter jeollabukensis]TLM90100.1 hypothetical protein FDY95_18975 [Hymenobacter jeollabukensis]